MGLIVYLYIQPFCNVTAVNPQVGSGYFSYPLRVYEGDTVSRVVDRIKRTAGTPGQFCVHVCVCVHVLSHPSIFELKHLNDY